MTKTIKSNVEAQEILPSEKYWKIKGINSQGKEFLYKVFADLTKPMNLESELPAFYEEQKELGNPTPVNSIQVYGVMRDAVNSKNASLINHLHKTFRTNYIRSLSVVVYSPVLAENGILHNSFTSDEFFEQGILLGPDGFVEDLTLKQRKPLELILDEKKLPNLNKVSQVINSTNFYLWRINSKPSEKIKTGVDFNANSGKFVVGAYWSLSDQDPAIRVLQEK